MWPWNGEMASQGQHHHLENYELEKEIGHGSFATVYRGHDKKTGRVVAVKAINSERLNKKLSENLATEISIMKELKSEHIVELYDLQKTGRFIYLVMEFCNGGDLAGFLRKRKILGEVEVRQLLVQLGEALRILSNANFAHRDLKPQNILLSGRAGEEPTVKLGDFGFARFVDPADLAETLCGSPLYMAPEILRYEKYDGRADLWSVGAIMYEMIFGQPPFRAQNHIQLLKIIEKSESIPLPRHAFISEEDPEHLINVSEECKDLILGLLKKNPDERLTFDQFITHPFLADHGAEKSTKTLTDTGSVTLEPRQQQRGFSIPRTPRQRSASSTGLAVSFRTERRSSLSASLKQQTIMQSAPAPQGPLSAPPSGGSQTFSAHEEFMFRDETRLLTLIEGFSLARPAMIKLIQRDARLGLLLKEIAEINTALLDKTTETSKTLSMETLQLLTVSAELFQGLLKAIKDSIMPTFEPANDGTRAMILWIYGNLKALHEKISTLQCQMVDTSLIQGAGLSITSSSVCSSTEPLQSISETIYGQALKYGRDGGLQELLGHLSLANGLYSRALFLLEILASPNKPSAFTDIKEPIPSQQDMRVIQGYISVVHHRSAALRSKPVAL